MNRDELASIMDSREYREEMNLTEERAAREARLLVVYGASDDLTEFRGALSDEAGAYGGQTHYLTKDLRQSFPRDDHDELIESGWTPPPEFLAIKAEWCPEGFAGSWRISFDGPHSKFNIMEDGELYCEGIVIDVAEVSAAKGIAA